MVFYSEFLRILVDEDVFMRAKVSGASKIEEEEVESKPENIIAEREILLDTLVQKAAKQYFTDDAWTLVVNVLTTLQGTYQSN